MTQVRIVKNYHFPGEQNRKKPVQGTVPSIFRQTPNGSGIWNGLKFTESAIENPDYVIVLNAPSAEIEVSCPPERVWAIMQEPPNSYYKHLHKGSNQFHRIYTTDESLSGSRYFHAQPTTPWLVNRDFDFLLNCAPPTKNGALSWVTSKLDYTEGHKQRLHFLNQLLEKVPVDLFGRDFTYLQDKWDGLAPYRYSLAVENFSCAHYWTEKIADCFLAWTMPIYWGCTNLDDYFPKDTYIQIDINDPDVFKTITEIIQSDLWEKKIDAIAHARELVLTKYQLFPFIASEIKKERMERPRQNFKSKKMKLQPATKQPGLLRRLSHYLR